MKKKTLRIFITLLVLICALGGIYIFQIKKKERDMAIEQKRLAMDYQRQNSAFERVSGHPVWEEQFADYSAIDQPQMYISLEAYNESWREYGYDIEELTLSDIEDYLSSEYNEDGTLRIYNGYENVKAYVYWYYMGGDREIEKYWEDLQVIASKFYCENLQIPYINEKRMNIYQLQELIKKRNDPSYEINIEVMVE